MNKITGKNFIYFHICILNNWEEVAIDILKKINESELINKIENIFFFVLGDITKENLDKIKKILELNPKYKLKSFKNKIQTYERLTINQLLDDCINKYEDCKILYLHTKGITRYGTYKYQYVKDWVDYLLYFTVIKHEDCINELNDNDTCGVNFRNDGRYLKYINVKHRYHYSGNFWWANSNYIKNLPKLDLNMKFTFDVNQLKSIFYYLEPEMWICLKAVKCMCLHESNVDHYAENYKIDQYRDMFKKKIYNLENYYDSNFNDSIAQSHNIDALEKSKKYLNLIEQKNNINNYEDALSIFKNNNFNFDDKNLQFLKTKYLFNSDFIKNINLKDYYNVICKNTNKDKFNSIMVLNIGTIKSFYKMKHYLLKLKNINNALFVITVHNELANIKPEIDNMFMDSQYILLEVVNKGFDIGPFILCLDYIHKNMLEYNVIFKIHTKNNDLWRFELLHELLENYNQIYDNLVNNKYYIYGSKKYNYKLDFGNSLCIDTILNNMEIYDKLPIPYFIAGTIFMCNKEFIQHFNKIFDYKNYVLFESIYQQYIGTYVSSITHSLERIFGVIEYLILLDNKYDNKQINLFYQNKYPQKNIIKNNINNLMNHNQNVVCNIICNTDKKLLIIIEKSDDDINMTLKNTYNEFDKIIILRRTNSNNFNYHGDNKIVIYNKSFREIKNIIKQENYSKTVIIVNSYAITENISRFYNCNEIYCYIDCYDYNNYSELKFIGDGNIIIIPNKFYKKLDSINFDDLEDIDDYIYKIPKMLESKSFININEILNENKNYLSNILFTDDNIYIDLLLNKQIGIYHNSRNWININDKLSGYCREKLLN